MRCDLWTAGVNNVRLLRLLFAQQPGMALPYRGGTRRDWIGDSRRVAYIASV